MSETHHSPYTMHFGSTKMYRYVKGSYWWNNMKRDIANFVEQCSTCQQVKAMHQRLAEMLKPLLTPKWKWDEIAMDFILGLPKTPSGEDSIQVVVDRLMKSAHFIPMKVKDPMDKLARLYVQNIVCLHGVPSAIILDRDSHFTSRFCQSLQKEIGTKLKFSTTFHPQTDGQSEQTNQILKDMLRACVLEFKGSWIQYLPLIEFAYNNSYQATIGMPPYEALYGQKCQSPLFGDNIGERQMLGLELIQDTRDKVCVIKERMSASQSRQKSYADNQRPLEFEVGDRVFLKVSPLRGVMRFGKKGKLSPRFIGPFKITQRVGKLAYRIALPPYLVGTHDVFHVSMLRKYIANPNVIVEYEPLEILEGLTYVEEPVKIVDKKDQVLRTKMIPIVKVLWRNHGVEEASWEAEHNMRNRYPHLFKQLCMTLSFKIILG